MQGEPGCDQSCGDEKEAKIAETDVQLFEVGDPHLAGLLALLVLLGRGEAGGRHRGIIAYLQLLFFTSGGGLNKQGSMQLVGCLLPCLVCSVIG